MVSRIKERLLQYKQELQKQTMYKEGLPGSSLDIVNSLLDDLEEDEKENGWIPVAERLPETDDTSWFHSATIPYRILDDTKLIKMEEAPFSRETKKEAMYRLDYLSMPGCHFQNHMRRTKWDIAN